MLAPLSQGGSLAIAHQLDFSRPLAGLPSQPGLLPDFENDGTFGGLAVTPLHLARLMAGLELEGRLPDPILSPITESTQTQAFSPATAHKVRALLPQVQEHVVGFSGRATPEDTGRQSSLSWFVGLAPTQTSPPPEDASSLLPFDPSLATPSPKPEVLAKPDQARYAVVVVVVTDDLESNPAFRVAQAPLKLLID